MSAIDPRAAGHHVASVMDADGIRSRAACGLRAALVAVLAGFAALPASAQDFDVPEGFASEIVRDLGTAGEPRAILRIHPEDGAFSGLSTVELEPVAGDIDDPVAWLRERMIARFEDLVPDPEAMMDNPDSPFGDPSFAELREAMSDLITRLAELGRLPLEYCDDPSERHNRAGSLHELSCRFTVGPISHYQVLRLQNVGGLWYYTRIRTMNERRLRHLLAIANSFHTD